jgi:CDP-diacylglycerol--serine O-phosphatidyltransferase
MDYKNMKAQSKPNYLFILPNLITATCLIFGFYAIIFAMEHDYKSAAICIILAGIADILDGRIARLTNTQSEFGKKFDSIADMVAFGIAPPLLAYQWSLSGLHWFGSMIAVSYVLAVATRLAKFSIQSTSHDNFSGLPCPPTSCMLAVIIWLATINGINPLNLSAGIACLMILVSIVMISNIQYNSLKTFSGKKHGLIFMMLLMISIAAAYYIGLPQVICAITLMYVLSGPAGAAVKKIK